ncbi:MAG: tetratricopeptide repeat protein, partial [Candidatus Riflebacteria bacterium]|nr:tetratricopeptide repeat protein [Candidatus Riflebacteria bacterium]
DIANYEGAAEEWAKTLKYREDDSKARNNYCDALLQLGRYDEGLKEIEIVLKAFPDYPPALCTKGELLECVGKKDEAKVIFSKLQDLIKDKIDWELLNKYVKTKL